MERWDFPGNSMVSTLHYHPTPGEQGSRWETKILHTVWWSLKNKMGPTAPHRWFGGGGAKRGARKQPSAPSPGGTEGGGLGEWLSWGPLAEWVDPEGLGEGPAPTPEFPETLLLAQAVGTSVILSLPPSRRPLGVWIQDLFLVSRTLIRNLQRLMHTYKYW